MMGATMTEQPRRQRRETADAEFGVGGLSPHPARGPITALRILGAGFEIVVDPSRAQRLRATVGDRVTVKGMEALALDEPTRQLIPALAVYFGIGAHDDVDSVLAAILWRYPIILHGSRSKDVLELAHTIHEHTNWKAFPFTELNTAPSSAEAIGELCTKAGCGTIFLDLTKPFELQPTFVHSLFSDRYHLWTIVVAQAVKDVHRCFGPGAELFPFYSAGFRRVSWHGSMHDVTFTNR
jgi:hypothetical protein